MVDVIYINAINTGGIPIDPVENTETLCKNFNDWLIKAAPGSKWCYYFGEYISGNKVARIAYKAYENNFVILCQKRVGNKFEYWAYRKGRSY